MLWGALHASTGPGNPEFLATVPMSTPRDGVTENTFVLGGWLHTHSMSHTHSRHPHSQDVQRISLAVRLDREPSQVRKCKTWISPSSKYKPVFQNSLQLVPRRVART